MTSTSRLAGLLSSVVAVQPAVELVMPPVKLALATADDASLAVVRPDSPCTIIYVAGMRWWQPWLASSIA